MCLAMIHKSKNYTQSINKIQIIEISLGDMKLIRKFKGFMAIHEIELLNRII